jgi:hypothetical protein
MKTVKRTVMALFICVSTVEAQNNNHKYYLEGGLSGGMQQNGMAAGTFGAAGIFFNQNNSFEARGREIFNFKDNTMVGVINFTYRHHFSSGFFIGGGFAHHHEIGGNDYLENPGTAALGTHSHMVHRSGIGFDAGYNFKSLTNEGFFSRIYPTTNISATYMFDNYRNPLITANFGLRIGLGRM